MRKDKVRVIVVTPPTDKNSPQYSLELLTLKTIDNTLESFQHEVGGLIEMFSIFHENNITIICNEEGKIRDGFKRCRVINDSRGNRIDTIYGTFLICGFDEEGNFDDVPEDLISPLVNMFSDYDVYIKPLTPTSEFEIKICVDDDNDTEDEEEE